MVLMTTDVPAHKAWGKPRAHLRRVWSVFRVRASALSLLVALAAAGCSTAVGTSTPGPLPSPSLTATPSPTLIPTASATATSTATPGPTPTLPHGVFTATGSLVADIGAETASLLDDGTVLVTGAEPGPAEIYDPASGKFHTTGTPSSDTADPLAVKLLTGRVLVIDGGETLGAQIYDPASGKFSSAGRTSVDRDTGAATLLHNGKVLVVGGILDPQGTGPGGVSRSAQIYDPASGKFTSTGQMKTGRACFTATTLQDGRVLIAGGDDGGCSGADHWFASAEIYDPASGKFTPTGSMTTPRSNATATLLASGKVLIAGGYGGGQTDLSSAELYDPGSGKFTPTGSMSTARTLDTATLLRDGGVLVAGDGTAELFDPATGRFTPTGHMLASTYNQAAVRLDDGRVLLVGGLGTADSGSSAELYWP